MKRRINRLNKKVRWRNSKVQQSQIIKEQEEIIADLTCRTLETLGENEHYGRQITDLNTSLDKALTDTLREQNMNWYYKDRKIKEHNKKKDLLDEETHCSRLSN